MTAHAAPILLLIASNAFMTVAWYWHLKVHGQSLWFIIVVSWSIALLEYCFAVPANRIGYHVYTAAQLKTIQEIITLSVFVAFSVVYLGEQLTLNHVIGFGFIALGAFFIFEGPL